LATKAQWETKIKSWVPAWFYTDKPTETAIIRAFAKVFSEIELDLDDEVAQTFIGEAVDGYLGMLGDERSVEKFPGEFDDDYRKRVRAAIISNANIPAIIALLNKIVIRGEVFVKEDYEVQAFMNRGAFLNRGEIFIEPILNTYTIVVDRQVHAPFSFFNRDFFCNRKDFIGQASSSAKVFDLMIKTVKEEKALGTFFRIVERNQ